MPQNLQLQIGMEDSRLIEDNQLGTPLTIYRLKLRDILFYRVFGWLALILSLLTWSALFILARINSQQILVLSAQHFHDPFVLEQLYNEHNSLIRSSVSVGCMFLLGLFLLLVRIPAMKKRRVIVCEYGLLQVRWNIRDNRIESVRWEEIQALESGRAFSNREYMRLIRKEGNPLVISDDYENFDELRARIRDSSQLP